MRYNILNFGDIHWGIKDPHEMEQHLEYILYTIELLFEQDILLDLIVISGDYWDSRLPLNSDSAVKGLNWFTRFMDTARKFKVKYVRVFKGTEEHDNDQLEAFREYEDESGFFKLYNTTTSEKLFENFRCLFCPDETINIEEWESTYVNLIHDDNQIGFFHGSFDVVFGELLELKPELLQKKNVVYNYNHMATVINGPLFSSHWHDGKNYDILQYTGSPDSWTFGEDEDKGILFIQYDTDSNEYFYQKIVNILATEYRTYEVFTNIFQSIEDYATLADNIFKELEKYKDNLNDIKIRIKVFITDDKQENDVWIQSLKHRFIDEKRVKITTKNKLKSNTKKVEKQSMQEYQSKYSFIMESKSEPAKVIQEFMLTQYGAEIPLDYIQSKIDKYRK